MVSLPIYYNYYRYKEFRKQTKTLVDDGYYGEARTKLENLIAEHIAKYPDSDETKGDFNFEEKAIMQHSLRHLNTTINKDDPIWIDSDTGEIKRHSDIVKNTLLENI